MSLVIHYTHAYAFIAGMVISKFTNMFSDFVITGLVLYIVTPEIYTEDRWNKLKSYIKTWTGNKNVLIQQVTTDDMNIIKNTDVQSENVDSFGLVRLPRIEDITQRK